MSRIAALAAICLAAGCVSDPEVICGDDAIESGGLTISFEGRDPATTYDFAIDAEGASLVLTAPPGVPTDPMTVDLGDDRTLRAEMTDSAGTFLNVSVLVPPPVLDAHLDPPFASFAGASPVQVIARVAGAEVGRATFTPTYDRDFPFGASCPFYDHAAATLTLSAPP
jgi:hypothetical protein